MYARFRRGRPCRNAQDDGLGHCLHCMLLVLQSIQLVSGSDKGEAHGQQKERRQFHARHDEHRARILAVTYTARDACSSQEEEQ